MLKPLYDKILIEPLPEKTFVFNEVELSPSVNVELPLFGKVVAVGNGVLSYGSLIPLTCKVGDVVIYPRGMGKLVYSEGKQLFLIKETDVLGIE